MYIKGDSEADSNHLDGCVAPWQHNKYVELVNGADHPQLHVVEIPYLKWAL